jgi:hypothetical protein
VAGFGLVVRLFGLQQGSDYLRCCGYLSGRLGSFVSVAGVDVCGFGVCHGFCSCGRDNSRTCPAVTGQALALSSCGDGDYPAGGSVGLLGFAAMCPKTNNLAAVGALAKGA